MSINPGPILYSDEVFIFKFKTGTPLPRTRHSSIQTPYKQGHGRLLPSYDVRHILNNAPKSAHEPHLISAPRMASTKLTTLSTWMSGPSRIKMGCGSTLISTRRVPAAPPSGPGRPCPASLRLVPLSTPAQPGARHQEIALTSSTYFYTYFFRSYDSLVSNDVFQVPLYPSHPTSGYELLPYRIYIDRSSDHGRTLEAEGVSTKTCSSIFTTREKKA